MATGYTRQSAASIVTGAVVTAAPLNAEFNALISSMDISSGHDHDGTTGGGAKIPVGGLANLADMKVLGNVSGGAAAVAAVTILDEDNMASDSATSLATQQSIKAYVDALGVTVAANVVLTNADVASTNADVVLTNADAVSTAADVVSTNADLVATNQDTIDTAADLVATNQDTIDTAADVVSTNADVVLTGLDVASTNADVVTTTQDAIDTAADVVSTNADVVTTTQDAIDTAADVVLTNADVVSTGNDLTATAQDVIDTAASAAAAAASVAGSMDKATYDPTTVAGDAFAMDSMVEGTTTKILTNTERAKLTAIEASADVTDETNVKSSLDGATTSLVTKADGDKVLILDVSDTGNLKHVLISDIVDEGLGKQTIVIPASAMISATTSGAASAQIESSSNKINVNVLDFDASADEYAHFNIAMPKSWNEGVIQFRAFWTTAATDTDGVAWGVQALAASDNDVIDGSWGTAIVVTDAAQSAANEILVSSISADLTVAGTPAAGDMVFYRVLRDVSDGADTMTEDARLISIQITYTNDALKDD